jgi:hypothetical protein
MPYKETSGAATDCLRYTVVAVLKEQSSFQVHLPTKCHDFAYSAFPDYSRLLHSDNATPNNWELCIALITLLNLELTRCRAVPKLIQSLSLIAAVTNQQMLPFSHSYGSTFKAYTRHLVKALKAHIYPK